MTQATATIDRPAPAAPAARPAPAAHHATGAWYAVQVATGQEDRALQFIREADEADALDDVFVPRAAVGVYDKQARKWTHQERTLFPGYLIAVARDAAGMERTLRRARTFARALGDQAGAVRLSDDEVAFLNAFTKRGQRTILPSHGYIEEGGRVVVTEGPLVGQEVLIVKVKHRKKRAVIRMRFCGRDKEVEVALHLIRGRKA